MEKIFWCEEKVQDFKDYVTSVAFRDHVERATGKMDDCINASIEIFTQAVYCSGLHVKNCQG